MDLLLPYLFLVQTYVQASFYNTVYIHSFFVCQILPKRVQKGIVTPIILLSQAWNKKMRNSYENVLAETLKMMNRFSVAIVTLGTTNVRLSIRTSVLFVHVQVV